jgi:catechol 2,3-dioxygenase-like lactoylglutathione lyase family enzyme
MKLIEVGSKLTKQKENKMSSNQVNSQNMKLEVVVIPVVDVDRSKDFYKTLGWRLDADFVTSEDFRVVQLTPPGSEASIIFGKGVSSAVPGSVQGLYLIVYRHRGSPRRTGRPGVPR